MSSSIMEPLTRFRSPAATVIPPPPPLLKIPSVSSSSNILRSYRQILPAVSSGPAQLMLHQTPFQAQYSPVQRTSSSSDHVTTAPLSPMSDLTSHLIGLLKAPPTVPLMTNSPMPITVSVEDTSIAITSDSDISSISNQDIRESNATKCKEYREKNKLKRKMDEIQYQYQYKRNQKLKAIYLKKKESIRKLKEYYKECLQESKFSCPECSHKNNNEDLDTNNDKSPQVIIKVDLDDFVAPVKNESEAIQ